MFPGIQKMLFRNPANVMMPAAMLLTMAVYLPVLTHGFLQFDDQVYVTANSQVRQGLTLNTVIWAFQATDAGFWHPLTWLSLMLDVSSFGPWAGGFHGTNLLLHLGAALLLYLALRRMTRDDVPSALVASLFALHPLQVESVAWIAERKDVLCGFFWMATLWSYARYVERPGKGRYVAVLAAYAACLMSKSMGVTLPLVLLLIDFWPLRRLRCAKTSWRLLREKVPLLALAAIVGILTIMAQADFGALKSAAETGLADRLANAVVTVWSYVGKLLLPTNLAVFYPPQSWPWYAVIASAIALLATMALVWRHRRRWPFLAVGWAWFLMTLAPVSGIVKVTSAAWADRYLYLPSIGLFLVLVWGGSALSRRRNAVVRIAPVLVMIMLIFLAVLTAIQVHYWRDDKTLFLRALSVTQDNYKAHHGLALALSGEGKWDAAEGHFQASLHLRPDDRAYNDLGVLYLKEKRYAEAETALRSALALRPRNPDALSNLGVALALQKKYDDAITAFEAVLRIRPDADGARQNLSRLLAERTPRKE